jgi:hypothetical protein
MQTIKLTMELEVDGNLNSVNPSVDFMEAIGNALLYHGNAGSLGFNNDEDDDISVSKVVLSTMDGATTQEFVYSD